MKYIASFLISQNRKRKLQGKFAWRKRLRATCLIFDLKGNLKIVLSDFCKTFKSEYSVLRQLIPVLKVGQITSLHANLS